jgi:hypothetical protein
MTTFVRVHSHRAMDRVQQVLGFKPQEYFSFWRPGQYWLEIPTARLAEVLAIKGIAKSKWREDMRKTIKWYDP